MGGGFGGPVLIDFGASIDMRRREHDYHNDHDETSSSSLSSSSSSSSSPFSHQLLVPLRHNAGSMSYAAPEITAPSLIGHARPSAGYCSDIWSLGICIYVCLTGTFPTIAGKRVAEAKTKDELTAMFASCGDSLLCTTSSSSSSSSSEDVVTLLQSMTKMNGMERPSIYTVLNSPWFAPAWDRLRRHRRRGSTTEREKNEEERKRRRNDVVTKNIKIRIQKY